MRIYNRLRTSAPARKHRNWLIVPPGRSIDLPDADAMWMLSVMGACWSGSPPSEDSPSGDGAVAERKTKPATATKKKSTKPKPAKAKSAAKK